MLRPTDHDGTHIDACDCGGLWFDPGEIAAWARARRLRGPLPEHGTGSPGAGEPMQCPKCTAATLQGRVLRGAQFAQCGRCRGVWLTPAGVARLDPEGGSDRIGDGLLSEVFAAFLHLLP